MQSKPVNSDTEGTIESGHMYLGSVRVKRVEVEKINVRAFFRQEQSKLSVNNQLPEY